MNTQPQDGIGSLARRLLAATLVLGAVMGAPQSHAQNSEKQPDHAAEEIDHLAIASRLIRDGHHDRAEVVLRQVDLRQPGLALDRYYALLGLAQLEQGHHAPASESLRKSIANGQKDPIVFAYLAQSEFGLKHWSGVIEALNAAGPAGRRASGLFLMLARAHWELGHHEQAIAVLVEGKVAHPEASDLDRARLTYLIELGLFQEVARVGAAYLERPDATAEDVAVVAEGLRRSRQIAQAKELLEVGRLRFPDEPKLTVLLAHTYLDGGSPLVAAMLFEDAARFDPALSLEAAELYLKAGRTERALSLNARVVDQRAKMKQRLSILLELERYEEIAAMDSRLSRLGLLSDESIRYALAYAHYKTGQYGPAEEHLKHLTDAKLFQQGVELRRAMQLCREAGWRCM